MSCDYISPFSNSDHMDYMDLPHMILVCNDCAIWMVYINQLQVSSMVPQNSFWYYNFTVLYSELY